MSSVLIFGGTTEGRELAELLGGSGIEADVCVATVYGSSVMEKSEHIHIHEGRLDEKGICELIKSLGCSVVVDATHPYAAVVTKAVMASCKSAGVKYLRLLRKETLMSGRNYESAAECATALKNEEGRVFLTTGSKELSVFTEDEELRKRLVVRVLPGIESIELCYKNGLEGRQIIAMQGPFSEEMNMAQMKMYGIRHLVTKESGKNGGTDEKLSAAEKLGVNVHFIERPLESDNALDMKEIIKELEELLKISVRRGVMRVSLAGLGPGSLEYMTESIKSRLAEADYIFGAERCLKGIVSSAVKYPYYLPDDICAVLDDIAAEHAGDKNIVILFTGDTGFFSGCLKMREALLSRKDVSCEILPGISSVSMLAARFKQTWQDCRIISLHGRDEDEWKSSLLGFAGHYNKTFFITSGVKDMARVGKLLSGMNVRLLIGYNLTYDNERLYELTPSECSSLCEEGLYCGMIINDSPEKRELLPVIEDEEFVRSSVPMTKEEIRTLSLSRLRLKEGEVLYDIGSGTGSVAISAAALSSDIRVYAIECKEEALDTIRNNCERFNCQNVCITEGMAPEVLSGLERADAAFIGGSRGRMKDILDTLLKINEHMRVVINAVSLESVGEINKLLKCYRVNRLKVSLVSVSRTRRAGDHNLLQANNPVFIFSFEFGGL